MGLLAGGTLTAILANRGFRQRWSINVPQNANRLTFNAVIFDDYDNIENDASSVIDAGSREVNAFNVSMQKPGKFGVGGYKFVVRNDDSLWSPNAATNLFQNSSTAYQATPQECEIIHQAYTLNPILESPRRGSWIEITEIKYVGRIVRIRSKDTANAINEPKGKQATVHTEQEAVATLLRRVFTEDDGDAVDTGVNIIL